VDVGRVVDVEGMPNQKLPGLGGVIGIGGAPIDQELGIGEIEFQVQLLSPGKL